MGLGTRAKAAPAGLAGGRSRGAIHWDGEPAAFQPPRSPTLAALLREHVHVLAWRSGCEGDCGSHRCRGAADERAWELAGRVLGTRHSEAEKRRKSPRRGLGSRGPGVRGDGVSLTPSEGRFSERGNINWLETAPEAEGGAWPAPRAAWPRAKQVLLPPLQRGGVTPVVMEAGKGRTAKSPPCPVGAGPPGAASPRSVLWPQMGRKRLLVTGARSAKACVTTGRLSVPAVGLVTPNQL